MSFENVLLSKNSFVLHLNNQTLRFELESKRNFSKRTLNVLSQARAQMMTLHYLWVLNCWYKYCSYNISGQAFISDKPKIYIPIQKAFENALWLIQQFDIIFIAQYMNDWVFDIFVRTLLAPNKKDVQFPYRRSFFHINCNFQLVSKLGGNYRSFVKFYAKF